MKNHGKIQFIGRFNRSEKSLYILPRIRCGGGHAVIDVLYLLTWLISVVSCACSILFYTNTGSRGSGCVGKIYHNHFVFFYLFILISPTVFRRQSSTNETRLWNFKSPRHSSWNIRVARYDLHRPCYRIKYIRRASRVWRV